MQNWDPDAGPPSAPSVTLPEVMTQLDTFGQSVRRCYPLSWYESRGTATQQQLQEVLSWAMHLAQQHTDASLLVDPQDKIANLHARYWCLYRMVVQAMAHHTSTTSNGGNRSTGSTGSRGQMAIAGPGQANGVSPVISPERALVRLSHIFECLKYGEVLRRSALALHRLLTLSEDNYERSGHVHFSLGYQSMMARWFGQPEPKYHERIRLLYFLLDRLAIEGLRKQGDDLFKEKMVYVGNRLCGTRFWEFVESFETFINRCCVKETSEFMWSILAKMPDLGHSVWKHLSKHPHHEVPELQISATLYSYRNGLLDISSWEPRFYAYVDGLANVPLSPEVASCLYIDQEFDPTWIRQARQDWFTIETPEFQSIMDYQNGHTSTRSQSMLEALREGLEEQFRDALIHLDREACACMTYATEAEQTQRLLEWVQGILSELQAKMPQWSNECQQAATNHITKEMTEDVNAKTEPPIRHRSSFPLEMQKWLYRLMGRLLYPLGSKDDWQIVPFLKGTAGTGKSTIAEVMQSLFQEKDMEVMSVSGEKTFGLQGFRGKRVWFMMEVKRGLNLSQADFQSMVSGERVSIAEKYKTAVTERWRAPGLMCGNECPGWLDSGGSIKRRLAIFPFRTKIRACDARPGLQNRIKNYELGALLFKCAYAYLQQLETAPGKSFWDQAPEEFNTEGLLMQSETDPVMKVLLDTRLERYDDVVSNLPMGTPRRSFRWPWQTFVDEYEQTWRAMRKTPFPEQLTEDKWLNTFHTLGLEVENVPLETGKECKVIVGIREKAQKHFTTISSEEVSSKHGAKTI